MADTLDSGKRRRSNGFRSAQSRGTGPTGPGGTTRPSAGRPSSRPGGTIRPSSGASLSSTAANTPVHGGGANPRASNLGSRGAQPLDASEQARLDQTNAGLNANTGDPAAAGEEQDHAASARQAANNNRAWANRSASPADTAATPKSTAGSSASTPGTSGTQPDTKPTPRQLFANNLKRNRNKYVAGGGIIGLIIALIFGFLALLPYKLESLMKNILEKRIENRIDHYVENRADKMLQKYLSASIGNSDQAFQRAIVNTGNPLKDLYRTWRVNKFEANLQADQGVRFQKGANGGIDVYKDGNLVGNYTGKEAKNLIDESVKTQTKWFQFVLRRHLRQWMRNAYGVTKWSFFKKLFNSKDNPTNTADEFTNNAVGDAAEAGARTTANTMGCALTLGAECTTDANNPDAADRVGELPQQPSETGNSEDGTIEGDVSDGQQTAADKAKQYLHSIASQTGGSADSSKLLGRVLSKFFDDEVTNDLVQLVSAAKGPLVIISLVDMASRIDNFFYSGSADKALVAAHEIQYANQFAEWTTIDDNWKAGDVSGDEVNTTMGYLNGIEGSQAFQNLYLNNESGRPLTTTDNGDGGTQNSTFDRSIDEHTPTIEIFYRAAFGDTVTPFSGVTWHQFLHGWLDTGGKIWGLVNSAIGAIFNLFFDALKNLFPILGTLWDWLINHVENWIVDLILWIAGLAVDGTERGADLANGLDAGGVVTGIGFARDLGAPQIGTQAAAQLDQTIAAENQQAADRLSIKDRIFSVDYANSLLNTVAAAAPASPDEAVHDSLSYYATVTQNPFKALQPLLHLFGIGQASAASTSDAASLYGMYDWGYTDAQLSGDDTQALDTAWQNASTRTGKPLPPANDLNPDPNTYLTASDVELSDCPKVADETKDPNLCRLDVATIQAMEANSTSADNGGLNSGGGGQ